MYLGKSCISAVVDAKKCSLSSKRRKRREKNALSLTLKLVSQKSYEKRDSLRIRKSFNFLGWLSGQESLLALAFHEPKALVKLEA